MAPVLRPRTSTVPPNTHENVSKGGTVPDADSFGPPSYEIDLSLPPVQRYAQLAQEFSAELHGVTDLFRVVVESWGLPVVLIRFVCRLLLRWLYSEEETAELVGIARAAKLEMYYIIAFNTFLDLFMGCTSGGVLVQDESKTQLRDKGGERMLHFRTLDWEMDELRKLVVKLDYVKDGQHVGTSISYVGFVGVLTAVRKDLSLSLNFRPNRDNSSFLSNVSFYLHLFFVLIGVRPSIASILRHHFFSPQEVSRIAQKISKTPSTAAYIILSDGEKTLVMEKDLYSARIRDARDFIAVTNHDLSHEEEPESAATLSTKASTTFIPGLQELVTESKQRKGSLHTFWAHAATKRRASRKDVTVVKRIDIVKWLETDPIRNEYTHFAVIMDPKQGKVLYLRRYLEPC
jgi:hypothetical protein